MSKFSQLDERYTINLEYCGHKSKLFVARFCGSFISSHETSELATIACIKHNKKRFA